MAAVIIIIVIVGLIFLSVKLNNLKYRAKQSVLNKAGIGDSNLTSASDEILESRKMKKFLENHPSYTEESIKQLIKDIASEVVNKNLTHSAEQKVIDKLTNDNKITKYANMQISRCNLYGYNEKAGLFIAKITLTDTKDEYMLFLTFQLSGDTLTLTKYQTQKGNVVGF